MTDIVRHNSDIDLCAFLDSITSRFVGLDSGDLADFMSRPCQLHTFMIRVEDPAQIGAAMEATTADPSARGLLESCTGMMIYVLQSPALKRPILVSDISGLTDWLATLPEQVDVVWGLADDPDPSDTLRILLIMRLE